MPVRGKLSAGGIVSICLRRIEVPVREKVWEGKMLFHSPLRNKGAREGKTQPRRINVPLRGVREGVREGSSSLPLAQ